MNSNFLCWTFFITLLFFQCGEVQRSSAIHHDDDLLDLLLDIQTARVVIDKSPPDERDSLAAIYWPQIMKLHGMSQVELDAVMDDLRAHPELYDTLFLSMSQKLDSLRSILTK